MIIDGNTIAKSVDEGIWKAWRDEEPITSKDLSIGVSSVDLTLGNRLLKPGGCESDVIDLVDPKCAMVWDTVEADHMGKFLLEPGEFALASVRERFDVSAPIDIAFTEYLSTAHFIGQFPSTVYSMVRVAPKLDGRSTVARMGLATHVTASDGHYGFDGNFTLELVNHSPLRIILTAGMRIAQLSFHVVTNDVTAYKGAYATNHVGGPFPPKLGKERF